MAWNRLSRADCENLVGALEALRDMGRPISQAGQAWLKARAEVKPPAPPPPPPPAPVTARERRAARKADLVRSAKLRRVLLLRYAEGATPGSIAAAVDMPRTAARAFLSQILLDYMDDHPHLAPAIGDSEEARTARHRELARRMVDDGFSQQWAPRPFPRPRKDAKR